MRVGEGKPGRVFFLGLENENRPIQAIENFAAEKGILAAQVFVLGNPVAAGLLAPGPDGAPRLGLPSGLDIRPEREIVLQELLGIELRRQLDPASGREFLIRNPSSRTRVMEKQAPAPEAAGPGSTPIYLLNAEFN
ncbi:MAG: hypothetical protein LBU64_13010 [Planctomycetota bacterium]|jgi:hypothetical protein|nr:hypothetical protein [Planctomycetota bacterium]